MIEKNSSFAESAPVSRRSYEVLLPSFIAGITAYQVSSFLGITYFYGPVNVLPVFSEAFLLKVMGAGLFFGICSIILIELLKLGGRISARLRMWPPLKGVIGGVVLVGLTFLFSTKYLGLGLETIEACFRGDVTDWYAFLVKPLFTSITIAFGGSGGVVTPIFFIGSSAGAFLAHLFHLNVATFAAIGFAAVLSGAANTPIAASIMAVELFGSTIAPYATVACVVSFLITGHRSVYPSQVISITKSPSLHVEIGKELEKVRTTVELRDKSLTKGILNMLKRIEDIVDKYYNR